MTFFYDNVCELGSWLVLVQGFLLLWWVQIAPSEKWGRGVYWGCMQNCLSLEVLFLAWNAP